MTNSEELADGQELLAGPVRVMFDMLPEAAWVYDVQTLQFLAVNVAAVQRYGWSAAEMTRMSLLDLRPTEDHDRVRELIARLAADPQPSDSGVWRHLTRDGRVLWEQIRSVPVTWGERPARFVITTDVSVHRETATALGQVRALSDAVLDATPEAVVLSDRRGTLTRVNPAAEAMFGRPAADLVGQPISVLMDDRLGARHQEYVESYLAGAGAAATGRIRHVRARRADGSLFPAELALAEVRGPDGLAFAAMLRDLTEQERTRRELEHRALHDELTDLPRRSVVESRLADALRRELPVAVVLLDLERFHLVNDGFGSQSGDLVLQVTAQRLRETADAAGAVVCRAGGDEFLVVAPRTAATTAVDLAERLIAAVELPVELGPGRVVPRARAGVSLRTRRGAPVHALVAEAYGACRTARSSAGRRVVVSPRGEADAARRSIDAELALRQALEDEEFVVHLQPVVRLADRAVVGAEALVRWQRPEGLVLPLDFVPLAEETGLIVPVGRRVIDQAVAATGRVLAAARGSRRGWRTWVNVSARELGPDLVPHIAQTLARHDVEPAHLGVELTETALLSAEELNAELLEDLRDLGVAVALDDFGTGYSSLSFLRQLPVDAIKIDRSFVAGMDADHGASAIVGAVVALGASLGMDLVAEGVERGEEAGLLREIGCAYAQGWLFGRPEPVDALLRRLAR